MACENATKLPSDELGTEMGLIFKESAKAIKSIKNLLSEASSEELTPEAPFLPGTTACCTVSARKRTTERAAISRRRLSAATHTHAESAQHLPCFPVIVIFVITNHEERAPTLLFCFGQE